MGRDVKKLLVVMPSWVGDAVMATPLLRVLRRGLPKAQITLMMRRNLKALMTGLPWADRLVTYRSSSGAIGASRQVLDLGMRVRNSGFDTALLLPNSFKAALICKLGGVKRVIGYDRDGRHLLLTDRLEAPKEKGKWKPTPIVGYYLKLAQSLDVTVDESTDRTLRLFVTESDRKEAAGALAKCGLDDALDRPLKKGDRPLVILNVGAQYGAAKCWLPEYFASVGDSLVEATGATVLVSGTPKERPIIDSVLGRMKHRGVDLSRSGIGLGGLKDVVRRCDLMITNDTGPRHMAAAFDVPVITVFGPTDPRWTEIDFTQERQVSIPVFCGPCQLKTCPLDHRCMKGVTPEMVLSRSMELLNNNKLKLNVL